MNCGLCTAFEVASSVLLAAAWLLKLGTHKAYIQDPDVIGGDESGT